MAKMREIATIRVFYGVNGNHHALQVVGKRISRADPILLPILTPSIVMARAEKYVPWAEDSLELIHGFDSAFHDVISVLVQEIIKLGEIKTLKGV